MTSHGTDMGRLTSLSNRVALFKVEVPPKILSDSPEISLFRRCKKLTASATSHCCASECGTKMKCKMILMWLRS